jgi:hypothetical protein
MFGRKGGQRPPQVAAPPEAAPFYAPADYPMEVVLRDPVTGRELRLGVQASLRDLEVLGSAGVHYATAYENPDRPEAQVRARRTRAKRVGQALWDAAVDQCGIEDPSGS